MGLTVAIIAGGQGRRLGGRVKALLEFDGRPLLERLVALGRHDDALLLVTNTPEPFAPYGLRLVADVVPGKGAPGGVVTALTHATTEWVLVVASDMPALRRPHVEALRAAIAPGVDAVVATRGEALEPLCALYRRSLAVPWRAALEHDPSLRGLIESVPHVRVPLPERALDSVNTPADLERLGGR